MNRSIKPPIALHLVLTCLLAAPLAAAADWHPIDDGARARQVVEDLETASAHLRADLRREKFGAMHKSAFTFLRGSAHLYHHDLLESGLLEKSAFELPEALTWLQGDAHVRNVGVFADDRGGVVFDFDDFDQAWPGNYLVDVWRMASSLHVFAAEVGVPDAGDRAARAFAESYLETVTGFAGNDREGSFQLHVDEARGPARRLIKETLEEEGPKVMTKQWTRGKKDRRSFRSLDDLERLDSATEQAVRDAVTAWSEDQKGPSGDLDSFEEGYFRILDVARRVKAGIGSRGVDRFYVLIEGPKAQEQKKPDVILDLKAQRGRPSLSRLFDSPAGLPAAGCRVALAERALLAQADDHLGCLEIADQSFSIRQRNPYKKSMKAKKVDGAGDLAKLATELGRVIGAAHARADVDFKPGPITGSFDDAFAAAVSTSAKRRAFIEEVAGFAKGYAEQVAFDYGAFLIWHKEL